MKTITRREILYGSGGLVGAATIGLPLVASAADSNNPAPQLKVVVAGGHPDDPESGCGGTMARYADEGHEVVSLYLTRGEAGLGDKTHEQAAKIRSAEAQAACRILRARPIFGGQIDANTELNRRRYAEFTNLLASEKPDVVFTHWPIDTHRDHRAASLLVYDAWMSSGKKFSLYYYEVMTGAETQHFWPTHYVDITRTLPRKHAAVLAHSWGHHGWIRHGPMNRFRGMECGCKYAEAFIRHVQSDAGAPGATERR